MKFMNKRNTLLVLVLCAVCCIVGCVCIVNELDYAGGFFFGSSIGSAILFGYMAGQTWND